MAVSRLVKLYDSFSQELNALSFKEPVAYVYNPIEYAKMPHSAYLNRYGCGTKRFLILGMNPGPFGMAQTGVPFGDVGMITNYLKIAGDVERPALEHPKRPILGYGCPRAEVSGQRLWGWIKEHYPSPYAFFDSAIILNYCPLIFLESSGRNLTPDKLPVEQKRPLEQLADSYLKKTVATVEPEWIISIGKWTGQKARKALDGEDLKHLTISHPSPASPKANRGWSALIEGELKEAGLDCWA